MGKLTYLVALKTLFKTPLKRRSIKSEAAFDKRLNAVEKYLNGVQKNLNGVLKHLNSVQNI